MDDVQLAMGASAEVGRLYRDAKAFSENTPGLALSFLRGLATAFCNCLDHEHSSQTLDERITSLDRQGLLKSPVRRRLRILQANGNKAAHPESFDFVSLDLSKLATESLEAARGLIEYLYIFRHESVPDYQVANLDCGALKDMCVRAMLDRDVEAMNQVGGYFKEKAEQHQDCGSHLMRGGYPFGARADIEQAMFWFKQGADEDHPNCMYEWGLYSSHPTSLDQEQIRLGEMYIARAANSGHADALVYVANSSLEGIGIFAKDEVYAREMFELAAQQGHPTALSQLGAMYAKGLGCEPNPTTAAMYIMKAAYAGIPQAQYNLSVLYFKGAGVLCDECEAIRWLTEADAQDYPHAVFSLACLIREGRVQERSPQDAESGFLRAMQFSDYSARAALFAAEMMHERSNCVSVLLNAAKHLQACYEIIQGNGDPDHLRSDCLEACSKVVGELRKYLNEHGPDVSLQADDIMTSALFDRCCVPYANKATRWSEITKRLIGAGPESIASNTEYLLREACLKAGPLSCVVPRAGGMRGGTGKPMQKQGRNQLCHCGSELKFKKCCGRGS